MIATQRLVSIFTLLLASRHAAADLPNGWVLQDFPRGSQSPIPLDPAFLNGFSGPGADSGICYLAWHSTAWHYTDQPWDTTNILWILDGSGKTIGSAIAPVAGSSVGSELPMTIEIEQFDGRRENGGNLFFTWSYGGKSWSTNSQYAPYLTNRQRCPKQAAWTFIDGCNTYLPNNLTNCIRAAFDCSSDGSKDDNSEASGSCVDPNEAPGFGVRVRGLDWTA